MAITGRKGLRQLEALFTFYILKTSNLSTKSNGLLTAISYRARRTAVLYKMTVIQLELYKQNGQYS